MLDLLVSPYIGTANLKNADAPTARRRPSQARDRPRRQVVFRFARGCQLSDALFGLTWWSFHLSHPRPA